MIVNRHFSVVLNLDQYEHSGYKASAAFLELVLYSGFRFRYISKLRCGLGTSHCGAAIMKKVVSTCLEWKLYGVKSFLDVFHRHNAFEWTVINDVSFEHVNVDFCRSTKCFKKPAEIIYDNMFSDVD